MNRILAIAATAVITMLPTVVAAQTLYAASGSNGFGGTLYRINATNGAATVVGPIRIGAAPIGLTGLAQNPTTGIMYGITTNDGPNPEAALVTVDPLTGNATLIGSLGSNGSDISFSASGTLYTWLANSRQLATVSLVTGAATPVGASGLATNKGGGLAFSPAGTLYLSALGSSGILDTLNTTTGVATAGPAMSGAPTPDAMDAMAFSSSGVLYAINTDRAGPATVNFLVTINPSSGVVTNVGALITNMDALAFGAAVAAAGPVPTLSQWSMIALSIALAVFGFLAIRTFGVGRSR